MPKILQSDEHDAAKVDPFGVRPCSCPTVVVHITDGDSLGDDIAECPACGWKMTLRELYKDISPPPGLMPGGDDDGGNGEA